MGAFFYSNPDPSVSLPDPNWPRPTKTGTVSDASRQNHFLAEPALHRDLLVIDEDLAQSLRLLPDLPAGYDMAVLPRSGTSLRHLTDHLRDCAPVKTLLLVLDGGPGYIRLGGQILDAMAIDRHQAEFLNWQTLLTPDACLILLVNGVTDGPQGQRFCLLLKHNLQRPVLFRLHQDTRSVLSALSSGRPRP